jgi:glyoxylase-like metal-dependent hydrolase (beta-lactamase superfamily II)
MHQASLEPPEWEPRSIQVGDWRITALCDGFMRLDGGSMWGVVPANIWRELTPPLEDNTILLALRPFLLERGDDKVLLEVGIGDRWTEKQRAIYHILPTTSLGESLAACGLTPEDVTHVVASHNHWDHIGHQVVERDGVLVPFCPKARHFANAAEVQNAKLGRHARSGSYRAEDTTVIEAAGLLELYSGEAELLPGLRAHQVGGHSQGVSLITINEGAPGAAGSPEVAIFWNDVVPTTHHIQPPYIMAYDVDVVLSFEQRSKWLAKAAAEGWIGLFYHDVDFPFGRLRFDGKRYELEVVEGELVPARG